MIARASIGAPRVRGRLRRLSRRGILGALVAGALVGAGPAGAAPPAIAARIQARFDLDAGAPSPFPADWFTVPDRTQRTGLRIANPPASCAPPRSVCDDLKLLAELDGFDLEPRLALRFTGVHRPGERQLPQRVPGPARCGAPGDHRRRPFGLGSGDLHALRASRERARAGDALRARGDARAARFGRPTRGAVGGLRRDPPVGRRTAARSGAARGLRPPPPGARAAPASAWIGSPSPRSSRPAASPRSSSRPGTPSTGGRPLPR